MGNKKKLKKKRNIRRMSQKKSDFDMTEKQSNNSMMSEFKFGEIQDDSKKRQSSNDPDNSSI